VSSLNSISSPCRTPTAFEVNSKTFGPTAAAAIGVAAKATDAVSSTVSFSSDGLQRLAGEIGEAWDGAVDAVGDAVDSVEDGIAGLGHGAMDAVTDAYHSIEGGVESVADSVEHVYDEATDAVGDAFSSVKSGLSSAVGTAAGYVSMLASALTLK
jgi:phage-related protein